MNLIERIKLHEGYRKRVYKDHLGNLTIGYGFLISELELNEEMSNTILERKVAKTMFELENTLRYYDILPKKVQDVLIEMAYQIGISGLMKFKKTLHYAKISEWGKMAEEMLDSRWAKQTPKRAKELSDVIKGMENV